MVEEAKTTYRKLTISRSFEEAEEHNSKEMRAYIKNTPVSIRWQAAVALIKTTFKYDPKKSYNDKTIRFK